MDAPTVGSLFSGIGGIDLGLERAGFRVAWQCEADPYARAVLTRHWPGVPCYPDVRALGCDVPPPDVLCGGFPCQPVSVAGKRLAQADPRWLWPAFADVIARLRPAVVLVENVPGLRTAGLRDVLADLAALGFDAEWTLVRASDVGAPHIRARIFLVATDADRAELRLEPGWLSRAYRAVAHEPDDAREARVSTNAADGYEPDRARTWRELGRACACGPSRDADRPWQLQSRRALADFWRRPSDDGGWPPVAPIRRVDDGIADGLDAPRLRVLGNAVVTQLAEWVGRLLLAAIRGRTGRMTC